MHVQNIPQVVSRSKVTTIQADNRKTLDFSPINKNFRHFPIARDGRTKLQWEIEKEEGYWYAFLSDKMVLTLPDDCGFRRHPDGFDVALLFTLTALSTSRNPYAIEHMSAAEILRHMGLTLNSRRSVRVSQAKALWSNATLIFEQWYTPDDAAEARSDKYDVIEIKRPMRKGRLSKQWLRLAGKYFQRVPLPLPIDARAQNLVLLLMGWQSRTFENGTHVLNFRSQRQITRAIGLHHERRNSELPEVVKLAAKWFKDRGGRLDWSTEPLALTCVWHLNASAAATRQPRGKRRSTTRKVRVDPAIEAEKQKAIARERSYRAQARDTRVSDEFAD